MRGLRVSPLVLATTLALAACAAQLGRSPDAADETATPEPTRPQVSAPALATIPPSGEPVSGEVPDEIMEPIIADAADRAGTDPGSVEVLQAQSVTWSDGSLDCPEPGILYTQALVDGYHVILEADGEELDYRVTADGGFRLCENGGRPSG
jgi:hypothetical protein